MHFGKSGCTVLMFADGICVFSDQLGSARVGCVKLNPVNRSDVVETVTIETESWLKLETETSSKDRDLRLSIRDRDSRLQFETETSRCVYFAEY